MLLLILAIGLIVRMAFTFYHGVLIPPDGIGYSNLAIQLAQDGKYTEPLPDGTEIPTCSRTPGYPLFLALFVWKGKLNTYAIALVQTLLAILTGLITYDLARRYLNKQVALWSVGLLMISMSHIPFSSMVLTEIVFGFTFLVGWRLLFYSYWQALLGGVLLGYAALIRPIGLPIMIGTFLCSILPPFRAYLNRLLIATGSFLVTILPWSWRCSLQQNYDFTFCWIRN